MRAIRFDAPGGPDVLHLAEVETPRPGPGEILVRNQAVGINFIDTYHRSGLYPVPLPSGLGLEAAGVVEAVGPGVTRFAPGDRAAYATGPVGAYAEFHVTGEHMAVGLPAWISAEQAAAGLLKGLTAEFLLRRTYKLAAGETVLVHAAAGGVGQILVQWAKAIGAVVIGTAGSEEKAALARELGADHVILYRNADVAAEVRRLTDGAGVRVAYDSVGKSTFEGTLGSIGKRGLFVSFGNASGPVPAFEPARLQQAGSLFFTRPMLFDYVATADEADAGAAAFFDQVAAGSVSIAIAAEYPLAEAADAHRAVESRDLAGSVILTV